MPENLPQGQSDQKLSQKASEWRQTLDEAVDIVIDLITLIERARNLYLRATRRPPA